MCIRDRVSANILSQKVKLPIVFDKMHSSFCYNSKKTGKSWELCKKPELIQCFSCDGFCTLLCDQSSIIDSSTIQGRPTPITYNRHRMCMNRHITASGTPVCLTCLSTHIAHIGRLHFLTETFAESKLFSKYLLKSKSEVISLRLSLSLKVFT